MMKRRSWQEYQKEIADDRYYYARSCIRQNFFPGSEKAFAPESVTIRISCPWRRL